MASNAHEAAGAVPVHTDSTLTGGPAPDAPSDAAVSRFVWQPGDLVLVQPAPAESTVGKRLAAAFARGSAKRG